MENKFFATDPMSACTVAFLVTRWCRYRPFYRTEQLIITRTGNHSPIVHTVSTPFITTTIFNPIFEKEFLHEVSASPLTLAGASGTVLPYAARCWQIEGVL